MFHAYCQNSIEHAKLANQVAISMRKTLKPALKSRCKFDRYRGRGHYYYFINAIRVVSYIVLDDGTLQNRYSGEYRRDYVYDGDIYNKDIFVDHTGLRNNTSAKETDMYKNSFFKHLWSETNIYKLDGVYVNHTENAMVGDSRVSVAIVKAGADTGDIISIDNRECFLFKNTDSYGYCFFFAIAID
ncbi:hypothetical protein [Campylobacter sp.]|uniref:hypothetical protein n=1 Tax=Campylobacter sp. TaxID=205 RepID=UPI002AA94E8D|nr:hypothetical protein [Campylobacter sp.]